MQAILIRGKHQIALEDVSEPTAKPGQVFITPRYVGICGSDLHYLADGSVGQSVIREPLIPGHEISALLLNDTVINEKKYPAGTPVTVHPATFGKRIASLSDQPEVWPNGRYLGSAQYLPHTQGGMAQKITVRPDQIRILPDNLSLKTAALAEPLSVGLHGIHLAGDVKGKRVLVSGAGPIGLLAAAGAIAHGAVEVIESDILDEPLKRAEALGVNGTINTAREALPDDYFDVVLECSGVAPAISAAFRAVAVGGTIIQVGMMIDRDLPLNLSRINGKEIVYRGSFRFHDEIDDAINILAKFPQFSQVVTHDFPAADYKEAFATAADSKLSGKVLIHFNH